MIWRADGTTGAILSGLLTVPATLGQALFSGLSVDKVGSGYRLFATNTLNGYTVTSEPFNIEQGLLAQLRYVH